MSRLTDDVRVARRKESMSKANKKYQQTDNYKDYKKQVYLNKIRSSYIDSVMVYINDKDNPEMTKKSYEFYNDILHTDNTAEIRKYAKEFFGDNYKNIHI